jgi:molybdopterin synthase sulfur carrier subunit
MQPAASPLDLPKGGFVCVGIGACCAARTQRGYLSPRNASLTPSAALARYLEINPRVRAFVLDDQGAVRWHVAIFLNGQLIQDRRQLSDPVGDGDEIFVAQALSGG